MTVPPSRATRTLAGCLTAIGLALIGAATLEPYRLRTRVVQVTLPRGCDALTGTRIAFLTDFHIGGPGPSARNTLEAIERLRAWRPHLVLLGGDYFDQGRFSQTAVFDGLCDVQPVFAVLGNHDYRQGEHNARRIAAFLAGRGVRVLRNECVVIDLPNGSQLELVGLDDPYTGLHDSSLLARPLTPHPRVLLAHSPSVLEAVPLGSADIGLFGHTHWGQIRLNWSRWLNPLDAAWYLDRIRKKPHARFQRGWFWERGMLAYVSSGIGQTQLPFRLFARPEVVLLEFAAHGADTHRPCDDPRRYVRERHGTGASGALR